MWCGLMGCIVVWSVCECVVFGCERCVCYIVCVCKCACMCTHDGVSACTYTYTPILTWMY